LRAVSRASSAHTPGQRDARAACGTRELVLSGNLDQLPANYRFEGGVVRVFDFGGVVVRVLGFGGVVTFFV
jgi:hypothetical protein